MSSGKVNLMQPRLSSIDVPFRILLVCKANHCRSPIAEHVLRQQLAASAVLDRWVISSAGTHAHSGTPIHPHAKTALGEIGIEVSADWTSTPLGLAAVSKSDLILTADISNRQSVVALVPRAVRHTLPLLQFTAMAGLVQPFGPLPAGAAGPELQRRAMLARSRLPLRQPASDNIPDPMGRDLDVFRQCVASIDQELQKLFRPILGRLEKTAPRRARHSADA